jgi:Domain of unknown function (DUF4193)
MAEDDIAADEDFEIEEDLEEDEFTADAPDEIEDLVDEAPDDEGYEDFEADEEVEPVAVAPAPKPAAPKVRRAADEDEEEDDDEVVDPDDVEADLDAILKDRIAAQPEDEDDDEDEAPEPDDRGDGTGRIQPKKADEFVCQSCFLVKHRRQLADETTMLCVDCV